MEIEYENKELCKTCGNCCKACGCSLSTDDFSQVRFDELRKRLDSGYVSIIWPLYYIYKSPDNIF